MVAFHMCIREVNDKRNVYVIRADTDDEGEERDGGYNQNYNTAEMTNFSSINNNNNYNYENNNKKKKRMSRQ